MKIILSLILGILIVIGTALISHQNFFSDSRCSAFSLSVCEDNRPCENNEELWTFACASDICGNSSKTECYVCVQN
jgi:hypothetical protein